VDSTRGLILSYRGGIVESLYAANRELANEAHGQLGASMSQQGARMLALRGYRYSQILATYYRGASLARLRRSA
jgi:peptidoglycan hydrolase-like amidase